MARNKFCVCGKVLKYNERCTCKKNGYIKQKQVEPNVEEVKDKEIRSRRWQIKRKYIINRDGGICQRCLIKYGIVNAEETQVHHIKPRVKFPELIYDDSNLICLCKTCNLQLGIQEELDFEWTPPDNNFTL